MLSKSILMTKTMRKKKLRIQILAGNTLMLRFHVGFEIKLPLGIWKYYHCSCKVKNLNQFWWLKGLHAAAAAASLCFLGKVCGKIHVCPAWVAASQAAGRLTSQLASESYRFGIFGLRHQTIWRCCCCSPLFSAMRDEIMQLRPTKHFSNT